MIAKVSTGRSFGGVVRYLFEGHHNDAEANKQAEVLAANGVRLGSMEQMIADFNRHRTVNTDLGVAVWHTALSFHADDRPKLTDQKLIGLAEYYMKALRLDPDNTQWLLVKHNDTAHPHIHLVMSRVDFDGRTIDKSFCKSRSKKVAIQIAKKQGLIVSLDRQNPTERYGKTLSPQRIKAEKHIEAALIEVLPQACTISDLTEHLKLHHIFLHLQRRKRRKGYGEISGLIFEHDGEFVKGSRLGSTYSAGQITAQLISNGNEVTTKPQQLLTLPDKLTLSGNKLPGTISHLPPPLKEYKTRMNRM